MRAGIGAEEAEHARVRTAGPGAPARHAALGCVVVPIHVVALIVGSSCSFVGKQRQRTEQHFGGCTDCSRTGDVTKRAALVVGLRIADRVGILPFIAYPVELDRAAGELLRRVRGVALRFHERAVGCVDRLPAEARRVLRVVGVGGVVVCEDLELAPDKPKATLPLPDVAVQIPDPGEGLVVAPRQRAGAGCHAAGFPFAVLVGRHGLVVAFAGVLPVVVVTVGKEAVFLAPEGDRGPLGVCAEVPAVALGLAGVPCRVKVNACRWILGGQAIRHALVVVGLILAVPEALDLLAVHNEGRVDRVVAAGQHFAVLKGGNIHHDGRQVGVVHHDGVVRADRFYCQIGEIKICHFRVLLSVYSTLQRISFTSAMSRSFLVRVVTASSPSPSVCSSYSAAGISICAT